MPRNEPNPIRTARLARRLTQADLGKRLGVTKATVCGYEADRYFPSPLKILRITQALRGGVTVEQLVRHYAHVEEREAA